MGNALVKEKIEAAKAAMQDMQIRQGDNMRSVQMAMQIAVTRDQLQWGAGVYSLLVSAATIATIKEKAFPKVLAPPLVILGVVLAYNYDFAYGTKLIRVRKEAEHILEHERDLLVPISAMPSRKFWSEEEKSPRLATISRVGDKWPFIGGFKH